jgi:hypothetical protein
VPDHGRLTGMNGEGNGNGQHWDAYPPGTYAPPAQYGPPPAHAPAPSYGSPPGYGPPSGYGAPPGYGPAQAYGQPPVYGAPGGWPMAPASWPRGPRRPGVATAAAVLGFVTGGLTALVSLIILFGVVGGTDEPSLVLMLLGFPCAVAVIAGAAVLMSRGAPHLLFGAALASVGVLALVGLVAMTTLYGDDLGAMTVLVVLALPLPVLTAVFARQPAVRGWAAAG